VNEKIDGLMRAIVITAPGGPEVLQVREQPILRPAAGAVLVRVEAAGVNRPYILQRLGRSAPPAGAPDIPGLEIAGTVAAVGPGTSRWQAGDAVCALVAGGGYAEYCVAPEPQCLPIPAGLSMTQAAALPETYFTVWTNVFQRGGLRAGEQALVHGGSSGIGTTAIQLTIAFGAGVLATAGTDEKCAAIARLGATPINYRREDFVARVQEITGGRGVDVLLDMVGGSYFARNLQCLAAGGRLVQIGLLGGARGEIDLGVVMQRRLTITGSTLRPRSVEEKGAIARELESRVWPLLAAGRVAPVIHATLPLAQAGEAHRMLEAGEVIGKVVLIP
jgi:NADPH2:quinone reductase